MPRLVLHAGLPKTGSTSIQRFLDVNASELREQGILYSPTPDRPGRRDNNLLAVAFWPNVQRIYRDRYGTDLERLHADSLEAWDRVLTDFRASGLETCLVSGEFFTRSQVKPFVDFARERLHDLEIMTVFYLRQPSAHYVSWLQQHIKGSNDLLPFGRQRGRWSKKFRLWQKIGDVSLREFDRDTLLHGDVVDDLASIVGADMSNLERPPHANESITAEGMALLLEHRRHHFADAPDRIMPRTLRLMEQIRSYETASGLSARPSLRPELASYLDSDVEELRKLDRWFGFRYSNIGDPRAVVPMPPAADIEGRVFERLDDLLLIDPAVRDQLRGQLERDGVEFAP